jgi:phage tail tube protein FII
MTIPRRFDDQYSQYDTNSLLATEQQTRPSGSRRSNHQQHQQGQSQQRSHDDNNDLIMQLSNISLPSITKQWTTYTCYGDTSAISNDIYYDDLENFTGVDMKNWTTAAAAAAASEPVATRRPNTYSPYGKEKLDVRLEGRLDRGHLDDNSRNQQKHIICNSNQKYDSDLHDDGIVDIDGLNGCLNYNTFSIASLAPQTIFGRAKAHASNSSPPLTKAGQDIKYWKQRIYHAESHLYYSKTAVADLRFSLGQTYMKSCQYDLAVDQFDRAQQIWQKKFGPNHLTVGRVLDAKGLALLRQQQQSQQRDSIVSSQKQLLQAQQFLNEAFAIRSRQLGVWHVDTVETYNKLASVYLHLGELIQACQAYHQVFLVRRAIFGMYHPSVAVSAHAVANVYYKLKKETESSHWYEVAISVYRGIPLRDDHPTVMKLLKDQSRLDHIVNGKITFLI